MKKLICLLLVCSTLPIISLAQKVIIAVGNPSEVARLNVIVAVKWADVVLKYPGIDTGNFKITDASTKKEIPYQLEYLGERTVQNLLVQVSIKAKSSNRLYLVAGKPQKILRKTYARYVPERYDDFAWENDKVAYRMYGKALETRKDNAFGVDVWAKRTSKLVIDDWYKSGDYHADHGDGLDYYSVGLTLGAGDIAPIVNDSIYFSKNYHHWKILDNGPLRSSFELGYDEWDVAGKMVRATKKISLDAGSHMNRVEVSYAYDGSEALPVAVGIVKRKEPGTILMDEAAGIMAYWEPEHGADGTIGVATIIEGGTSNSKDSLKMNTDKSHLLTYTSVKNTQSFVYYHGSAWNKANEIVSASKWFEYIYNYKQHLQQPLTVNVQ